MRKAELGRSDLVVTDMCLGTMTWGNQTDEADAHAQIDLALDHGINFIDTAEIYPVNPVRPETVGRTEEILGNWIGKTGRRSDIVLATKIGGAGGVAREGAPITSAEIAKAVEASLRRLQTDVIDLYQLHWPNRGSYCFRNNWRYDPSGQNRQETLDHIDDVLGELSRQIEAGRIRHIGLSNESAWGTAMWLQRAEAVGGPRMQAIQNEYSLLHRLFDTDLAELSVNEDVGLLAYSPLAAGLLTGKYRGGAVPEGSRMAIGKDLGGRATARAHQAVEAYVEIADRFGLDLIHMALLFCRARPFTASTILGATTADQLRHCLGAVNLTLSPEVLEALDMVHKEHPLPY